MRFDTRLVRVGQEPANGTGDIVSPIHVSVSYERRAQQPPRYFYARGENPTRDALERCLASLEDARHAAVFASGQAAAATALALLPRHAHLVCHDDVYSGTDLLAAKLGYPVHYADLNDADQLSTALSVPAVGMVWLETPTNPLLDVVDIAAIRRRLPGRRVLLVVDNTLASPALQQPLALGADISLYSTTKFIAGHGDVLGGALVYHDDALDEAIRGYRTAAGNAGSALDCFLVHRGLKTLSLRVHRQVRTAQALVETLRACDEVATIHYPGLAEHPRQAIAKAQMAQPGSIISFEYLGDPRRLLRRVRIFSCAVSLGGVQSLIEAPALMTHSGLPAAVLARRGITDSLIRLSVGIEDPHDLIEDLSQALCR